MNNPRPDPRLDTLINAIMAIPGPVLLSDQIAIGKDGLPCDPVERRKTLETAFALADIINARKDVG